MDIPLTEIGEKEVLRQNTSGLTALTIEKIGNGYIIISKPPGFFYGCKKEFCATLADLFEIIDKEFGRQ